VLDALLKLSTHPTIEEIYAQIHKDHPSISKTTVYRNLRGLAGGGIIRQVSLPDGLERYDGSAHLHYHFKCKGCGCIYDVDIENIIDINDAVAGKHGFQVDSHDIVFSGVCLKCKTKNKT